MLIFAFQADNLLQRPLHIALIAVPILIQVYFNSSLTYGLMRLLRVPYAIAAPGALIGASNFFELAVATAIALFGPDSGAALATVVGRPRRGPGDAFGLRGLQPDPRLVRVGLQRIPCTLRSTDPIITSEEAGVMPDPKFTKPWHGVAREGIDWQPIVIENACIGCGICVTKQVDRLILTFFPEPEVLR